MICIYCSYTVVREYYKVIFSSAVYFSLMFVPSLLWCCWLGGRKGIRPVIKLSGGMPAWLCGWVKVQICIQPSWCHCHSLSFAPVNPDWFYLPGFTFWCRLTCIVLDKIQEGRKTVLCVHACVRCSYFCPWLLQMLSFFIECFHCSTISIDILKYLLDTRCLLFELQLRFPKEYISLA